MLRFITTQDWIMAAVGVCVLLHLTRDIIRDFKADREFYRDK